MFYAHLRADAFLQVIKAFQLFRNIFSLCHILNAKEANLISRVWAATVPWHALGYKFRVPTIEH